MDQDYIEQARMQNRRLDNIERTLNETSATLTNVLVELAKLTKHVEAQNGRIGDAEDDIDILQDKFEDMRVAAGKEEVRQEESTDLVKRVKDNWWGIAQAILLVLILAELGLS